MTNASLAVTVLTTIFCRFSTKAIAGKPFPSPASAVLFETRWWRFCSVPPPLVSNTRQASSIAIEHFASWLHFWTRSPCVSRARTRKPAYTL